MENNKDYLSTQEIDDDPSIPLTKSFLDKARVRGVGPAYVKIGSRVFYHKDRLKSWIAARERRSTSDSSNEEAA